MQTLPNTHIRTNYVPTQPTNGARGAQQQGQSTFKHVARESGMHLGRRNEVKSHPVEVNKYTFACMHIVCVTVNILSRANINNKQQCCGGRVGERGGTSESG